MPFSCAISFGCSIQILNRAAAYPMSKTDSQNAQQGPLRRAEAYALGHSKDCFEARTKSEAFFNILSYKGRQRRIHDRMPDQSFQP